MASISLQEQIDGLESGQVLTIDAPKREYRGPLVFRHPISVEGQGATIWAPAVDGPVLTILNPGVSLSRLNVEITDFGVQSAAEAFSTAMVVTPGCDPDLNAVEIRGDVVGVAGEEGHWSYPGCLHLGSFRAGRGHEYRFRVCNPVPCQISSEHQGVMVSPAKIPAGTSEITIMLDAFPLGSLLRGAGLLLGTRLSRRIVINGVATADGGLGNGELIWTHTE